MPSSVKRLPKNKTVLKIGIRHCYPKEGSKDGHYAEKCIDTVYPNVKYFYEKSKDKGEVAVFMNKKKIYDRLGDDGKFTPKVCEKLVARIEEELSNS